MPSSIAMLPDWELELALEESLAYLASDAALESIRADPYWPKWDSPWWRMTLIWELGRAALIPAVAVNAMVQGLSSHYLPGFPQSDDVPPGIDPWRQVTCHCAVGTMFQVLHACGVNVDCRLPWMRPWLHRYQLRDGGLNCDERAYAKPDGKSSIVSTLPALEAVLRCSVKPWSETTARFLERGARYLVKHRLVRRAGGDGSLIDAAWLEPTFPRFYFYDVLRGLSFLTAWAEASASTVPRAAINSALEVVDRICAATGGIAIRRRAASTGEKTMDRSSGTWQLAEASRSFALLELASRLGRISPELTAEFEQVRRRVDDLSIRGLLTNDPVA